MTRRFGLLKCVCLGAMAVASTSLGADEYQPVRSSALALEFRAPPGWIVRHFTENEESVVAITRELLDGFPRYRVGFSATSVNRERRRRKVSPLAMARALCERAQERKIATSECLESHVDGVARLEWRVFYPPDSRERTGTVAWAVCLADEAGDSLVRLVFEAPEPEWAGVESVAKELMTKVRRIPPLAGHTAGEAPATFSGEYFYNFENAAFTLNGSDECWAVKGDMSKAELPSTHPSGPWGWTTVVLRGVVGPKGRFGNLGSCSRAIEVIEILEVSNMRRGP